MPEGGAGAARLALKGVTIMRQVWMSVLGCVLLVAHEAAAQPKTVLKLATIAPEGSPWANSMIDWKARVEAAGAGAVKVKLFLGGTLGDETDTSLKVKNGELQIFAGSGGAVAKHVPELAVIELPYLFESGEEVDYVIDVVAQKSLRQSLARAGFVPIVWSENGFRNYGGTTPVTAPADLKGKKVRSQPQPVHLALHRAFGALPEPLEISEVLDALKNGKVTHYDQSPLFALAAGWQNATKYYSLTEHMYQLAMVVMNKAAYEALPPAVIAAMESAAGDITRPLRARIREMNPQLMKNFAGAGVTIVPLTPEQRAAFVSASASVRMSYLLSASPAQQELYHAIERALKVRRSSRK